MYKRALKLMYLAFILVIPTILTACGGAASGGGSTPPGDSISKPDVNSSAASSEPKSSVASSPVSSVAISSPASSLAAVASSKAISSESYVRASRSSQSSTSQDSRPGFDFLAPEATKLHLYRLSENSITLVWDESFDNVGVSHYEIKRSGKLVATFEDSGQIFSDQNLASNTDYSYTITTFDLAGNDSGASPALNVRTLGEPNSQPSSLSSSSKSSVQSSSNKSSLNSSGSSKSASSSHLSSSAKSSSSYNSSSSAKSTSSASSSASSQKSVKLTWTHPNQRENGQFLELNEIGGYEIRYRKTTDPRYTYIVINSNRVTEYTQANANDTEFEIAVFDSNGVYSRFVKVTQ